MTRTGLSPRLGAHLPEPFVEVHPADAAELGLVDGGFARLHSPHGACVLKVRISEGQRRGSLFAPIHWSETTSSSSRVGDLVAPATDPYSGQPEAKATPVSIAPVEFAYSRLRADPRSDRAAARRMVVPGGRQRRPGLLLASNEGNCCVARHGSKRFVCRRKSRNMSMSRAASIAPRYLSRAASKVACSSVRPRHRRHGTR